MGLSGYLKIDDIDGESVRVGHEDEIDVHGVHWQVRRATSSGRGTGRARARALVDSLTCSKRTDASSPHLALACLQGRSFSSAVLTVGRDSDGGQFDYLIITMENVAVSGYEMMNDGSEADDTEITERVAFSFEKVTYSYTVQSGDNSAGDEHEVEFDIVSGV